MVNTWKKKLIFTCLCLFLLETHSVPLHKVFYISQIIAYFVSTWESRSPRYTACQSQALIRFFKCYFNYLPSQNNIIINIASACFLFLYFFILTRNNTCTMYFFVNWKKITLLFNLLHLNWVFIVFSFPAALKVMLKTTPSVQFVLQKTGKQTCL